MHVPRGTFGAVVLRWLVLLGTTPTTALVYQVQPWFGLGGVRCSVPGFRGCGLVGFHG
jgi:hypothetical protein